MGIEQEPRFEKPVPWDESVIPPLRREYLRKLYEDPKEVERFWSDEELGKKLEEENFQEMMEMVLQAVDIEYSEPGKNEIDKEYGDLRDEYDKKERDLFKSYKSKSDALKEPGIFREWFTLEMDFRVKADELKRAFNLAEFIGYAYELEARYYNGLGIPIGSQSGAYPFEEPREVIKKRFEKEIMNKRKADALKKEEERVVPEGEIFRKEEPETLKKKKKALAKEG
ncbi:MAG: hypothetical protein HYW09_01150, partial [Candidatus Niyogibacteria bacterium]|nr:hypothetical protein [Candidatus Niyogibacteria bacterium]